MSHAAYMPDAGLFARAATGDGEALGVLIDRHAATLYDLALRLLGDERADLAASLVVTAFADLARGLFTPPLTLDTPRLALAANALAASQTRSASARDRALLELSARQRLPDTAVAALLGLDVGVLPAERARALAAFQSAGDGDALDALPTPLSPDLADDLRWRVFQTLPAERRPASVAPPPSAPLVVPPTAVAPAASPAREPSAGPPRRWWDQHGERARRDSYRRLDQRSPLRVLLPLAVIAVLLAVVTAQRLPEPPLATPTAPVVGIWPTLPPRPSATTPPTLAVAVVPSTATPPPTASATASGPPTVLPPTSAATAPTPLPTEPPVVAAAQPSVPRPVPPVPAPVMPPVPALAPTTTVAATPVASPSATATQPTAAKLALETKELNLGLETGPRLIHFKNAGSDPLVWRAREDSTWLAVSPASGTLAPGAATQVAVTIDRGALPTGNYSGNVQLQTNAGDRVVPVVMFISPTNTTISAFAEPTAPINADGCADPTTYAVTAEITGAAPPRSAVLYYALNGAAERSKPLTASGPHYSATLGPFAEPGSVTYSLVITEADGSVNRSASYTLVVQDCPSRVRTIPVTLPTSQRFTIGARGHNVYTFSVTQPGNIVAQLSWDGSAPRLSTLLYGPQRADQPYEQRTGAKSLAFAYAVTPDDVAAGGVWALHLVNYSDGEATGTLLLTFEPRGAPVPPSAPTPPATPSATKPTPSPSPTPVPATPHATPATPTKRP